ncbi:hypothetical protein V6N13_098231 [Hibiscus sabdariffa]|uniref:Uncharacterized protein n=1 Tax=Hibiscus sabdariffa TaxID=183260 RepID=A0ABR2EGT1_9ROSI
MFNLQVKVSILNFQQYRQPGWKLGWDWKGDEAIWSMQGARKLLQVQKEANCLSVVTKPLPLLIYYLEPHKTFKPLIVAKDVSYHPRTLQERSISAGENSDFNMPEPGAPV